MKINNNNAFQNPVKGAGKAAKAGAKAGAAAAAQAGKAGKAAQAEKKGDTLELTKIAGAAGAATAAVALTSPILAPIALPATLSVIALKGAAEVLPAAKRVDDALNQMARQIVDKMFK